MARTLDVYLHNQCVGRLLQDDDGQMGFTYDPDWLEQPAAVPLSQSLPLRRTGFTRKDCRGFFAGILPEERNREIIARNLGISAGNDFAMLEQIGRECAGAVTFIPPGEPPPGNHDEYRQLSKQELAKILRALPQRPLMAGDEGVRLSLAGAQDKMAVRVDGHEISIPLGGAPSTHILKPAIDRFEGIVFNEAVCMMLSAKIGLPTAEVEVGTVEGIDYLLVKRYDRTKGSDGTVQRYHQEDFCQALAVAPEMKYQSEGGPSLKSCFDLIRNVSTSPVIDLQNMLDSVIANILIGNHDAHAKNFSLLYGDIDSRARTETRITRLAPRYDLISTVFYPELSSRLAMKLGGEYDSTKLLPRHFEQQAVEVGLAKPLVVRRVLELAGTMLTELDTLKIDHDVARKVISQIRTRCEFFLSRFKKG